MAKPKTKSKFLYAIGKERGNSSWSENSSSESERSILVNPEGLRHNSEVLKRQRHYQEFKRLYYSRLKSKERRDGKKHDVQAKWIEAVAAARKKESSDKIPIRRMTSSKINHRQKSYIDKIVSRYQNASTSKKPSCESIKLMYAALSAVGEDRKRDHEARHKHTRDKHVDKDDEEEYRRHRRKHHRHDEEEYELPLEEYYRRYHKHIEKERNRDSSPPQREHKHRRHSVEYDEDEFERRRKIYENYQKYVRRHSEERDKRRKSDKHDNDDYRALRHRSEDHTDKLKRLDKYRYEREHKRYDSPEEVMLDDSGRRHRSRSSKSGKYPDDEDYEMIERLERYIMEKKIGNTIKHHKSRENRRDDESPKCYLYSHHNTTRVASTDHFPLDDNGRSSYTCHHVVFEREDKRKSPRRTKSKQIQYDEDDVEIPLKEESIKENVKENMKGNMNENIEENIKENMKENVKELPERDVDKFEQNVETPQFQTTATNSQKLLIEQEIQCVQVEKKSQASETKVISRITPLKLPRKKSNLKQDKKPTQSSTLCCKPNKLESTNTSSASGSKKNSIIKKEDSQNNRKQLKRKNESAETVRSQKNRKERSSPVSIKKEPKKYSKKSCDAAKSPSLLSTIGHMEERAIKTLEALKDAEKIIINEKKSEDINDDGKKVARITSFHQQHQEELEHKLLILKLQELERKQSELQEKYDLKTNMSKTISKSISKSMPKSISKSSKEERIIEKNNLNKENDVVTFNLYMADKISKDDKLSPNSSDLYGKLKLYDVDVEEDVRQKLAPIKRIKWKGEEKNSNWLDVRNEDIIIDRKFSYGTDSSENNLTGDEYERNQKVVPDWNDTIQEEETSSIPNIIELNEEIVGDSNVNKAMESCREKLAEEIRKMILEPLSMLKSETSLKNQIDSKKIESSNLISKDNVSKSKLPIRVNSNLRKIISDTKDCNECNAEKLIDIYHEHGYDNEELLETLQKVIDYQKIPSQSATPHRKFESKPKNKQSAFQKVKKLIVGDKKKDSKKNNSKKTTAQYEIVTQTCVNHSPEDETLRQAINLFNIHKSTLSLVHGEISHLEQKISELLKRREKSKERISRIPRRIS